LVRLAGRLIAAGLVLVHVPWSLADDWPTLGRSPWRNPVSPEKNPPIAWNVTFDNEGELKGVSKNIRWTARLGDRTVCDPVIAGGLVWVGTRKPVPGQKRSGAALLCFRERDGALVHEHFSEGKGGPSDDWNYAGHSSSPLVEGDRVWFTTIASEVGCLDVAPLRSGKGPPTQVWKLDLATLGVVPGRAPMGYGKTCSVAGWRDRIFVTTGNGVDENHITRAPKAPSLLCLDKNSGKLLWSDNSPGARLTEGHWGSPLVIEADGRPQVVAAQTDGIVRSFDVLTGALVWSWDCDPGFDEKKAQAENRIRRCVLATPVWREGRLYFATGALPVDPNPPRFGWVVCLDPGKKGDVSLEKADAAGKLTANPNSATIWRFGGLIEPKPKKGRRAHFGSALASVAVHRDLVIAVEEYGFIHCLSAKSGVKHWTFDSKAPIVAAPLIADDKVYVTDEDGFVHVFNLAADPTVAMRRAGTEWRPIAQHDMGYYFHTSPVFANGTLYVATGQRLYAIER
jgi:outer membrane protein assembly factor BamB